MPESPEMGAWNQCFLNNTSPRCSSGLRIKSHRDQRSPFFPMKRRFGFISSLMKSNQLPLLWAEGQSVHRKTSPLCCLQPGLIVTWWNELPRCEDTIAKLSLHMITRSLVHGMVCAGNGNIASSSSAVQGTSAGEKRELCSGKSVPGNWRVGKRMLGCQLPSQPWTLLFTEGLLEGFSDHWRRKPAS